MDLYILFVFVHIVGTILGVGGATVAEVQIFKALKDGKISPDERYLMHANYKLIRVGIFLIFVSAAALLFWHLGNGNDWVLTSPKVWVKDIMFFVIILNAVLLTKRMVPLWLGSAISFTSWWGATLLGVTHKLTYTFAQFIFAYIISVVLVAFTLHLLRKYYLRTV